MAMSVGVWTGRLAEVCTASLQQYLEWAGNEAFIIILTAFLRGRRHARHTEWIMPS